MVSLGTRVWQWSRKIAAPFGELDCALFFERSLAKPVLLPANSLGASIRSAEETDLDIICHLYAGDAWLWLGDGPRDETARGLYLDRLRRGERCFLAFVDGVLAHVNWTCFTWGDALPGRPIRLRPGEIYTTDAFTPPAFRGKGMHALVLGTMLAEARRLGAQHAYTLGQLDRPDAHKGLRALGWQECGRVLYFLPRGAARTPFLCRCGMTEPLFRD
jgi:GNAT superfamily N-acetyltransferase